MTSPAGKHIDRYTNFPVHVQITCPMSHVSSVHRTKNEPSRPQHYHDDCNDDDINNEGDDKVRP